MPRFFNVIRATVLDVIIKEEPAAPALPAGLPESVRLVAVEAVKLLLGYQGPRLAQLYGDRLRRFIGRRGVDDALFCEIARQMAIRMAYLDAIRIAQLKLEELGMPGLHPGVDIRRFRFDELVSALPEIVGDPVLWGLEWLGISHRTVAIRFSTASRIGIARLRAEAWLRRWRHLSVRYETERRWVERWLHMIDRSLARRPEAAAAIVATATMIEGYGTGYRQGVAAWHQVIDGLAKPVFDGALVLPDLAAAIAEAREAPRDPRGDTLRALIMDIRSRELAAAQ